eukprot:CAMPEP_0178901230 /NCGR_PEP_ID=MMETSP0786-20121207/3907_1 /TAXON_ID=186022 /ORGANISM="Thalassionema frauenfeldii, Strain CCMP 1798" /LENGTH=623 /DNA_ID=CAMNT_0020572309 /DNA_START=315 /DNA_END=2186 /DNA_ORIENTATION=-
MVKLSTKRYFADRNTQWDDLFESSKTDEKKERCIPPASGGSSTYGDEDAGWYDYNPGDDGLSDIEMDSSVEEILRADGYKPKASNYHEEASERSEFYTDPSTNTEKSDVTARSNAAKTATSETLSTFPEAPSNFTRVEMTIPLDRQYIFSKKNFQNNGGPIDTDLNQRKDRLRELEQRIFEDYNDGKEFNLNSPKQISTVLFGTPNESTSKNALESLSTCKDPQKASLADLILTYRKDKQAIKRLERKEKGNESGKSITSFFRAEKLNYQSGVENNDDDPLLLIDASSYIFRAYYSMPPLHRHDGMPVGAVMGFCNMLNRVLMNRAIESLISESDDKDTSRIEPARVIMVFDAKGKNFRHDMFPEYKANRPPCPMDLIPQFDLIHDAAKAYGIPEVEAEGFEADDVIATLATSALTQGINTHILSSDKDLMQLVVDKNETSTNYIHMMDPQSMSRIDKEAVMDKWNVSRPEMVGDLLALSGDSADNIPGVPGIGPKTAALLLEQFESLDNLYKNVDSIRQKRRRELLVENKEKAFLSRKLVELERSIPFERMVGTLSSFNLVESRMQRLESERILGFYKTMGFKDLHRRIQNRITLQKKKRPVRKKRPKAQIPNPEDFKDVPF